MVASHPNISELPDGTVWFRETPTLWPGQAMTLEVDAVLHQEQSLYQDVLFFRSKTYGNVLALDGVLQCTERDEFAYQEMIAHLPMHAHPNARKVLVIGGGDGGVVREVLKHASVESVVLCEIDEAVPRLSRLYLPQMAASLADPRVTVHIGDGFAYLQEHVEEFDVIITDSSDPVGPAESLFQPTFFELLRQALRPDGILCTQCECIWLHLEIIEKVLGQVRTLFDRVSYAYTTIPTYPSGQIGFLLCAKNPATELCKPVKQLPPKVESELKYYSTKLHEAAFVLPAFAQTVVARALSSGGTAP